MTSSPARSRYALILGVGLLLSGCKETLYSGLHETEANAMVAVLASAGIDASRDRDKKNVYAVLVASADVPSSITLLMNAGFPREQFQSLGDVFGADRMIGTPFEQHARFMHAMNQELSQTLTRISGVRSARVFVTAPPKDRYDPAPARARALVTLYHEAGFDPEPNVARIKSIVMFSVADLSYDDISVVMFPAGGPEVTLDAPAGASAVPVAASATIVPLARMFDRDWRDVLSAGPSGLGRGGLVSGIALLAVVLAALPVAMTLVRSRPARTAAPRPKPGR